MRCFRLTVSALVGPGTFSAALATKSLLKEYGGSGSCWWVNRWAITDAVTLEL